MQRLALDIIIEGLITEEEGMNEVIETILYLKSVPNALLRVSCKEESLQGRVGFASGWLYFRRLY